MTLDNNKKQLVEALFAEYGKTELTRSEINSYIDNNGLKNPGWLKSDKYKIGRGVYTLPVDGNDVSPVVKEVKQKSKVETAESVDTVNKAAMIISSLTGNIVPTKDDVFVPWGHFKDIKSIVSSKQFYPIFITGLSGNGKTMNVQQACAQSKRECIRVNITIETDEDDLLGGYRLQDGQTVWQNGPVIEAMERGALLLLDEIDLASNKIMCLQPILEGNGVFLKKINKFVQPANGFNVIATANTKGQGSDDGKFIGTNVLNEAFLERFPITVEQSYPTNKIENKILDNVMSDKKLTRKQDEKFAIDLVNWADIIRKTFYEGGVDEIISTRRLVHIVEAFSIFKNKMKAIEMCTNRFDLDTKTSFLDLYTKIDGGEDVASWGQPEVEETQTESNDSEEDIYS
ncbi:MAG: MoxR family ATPase [Candidatus Pelagibacter sp. TMED239]|nr:MAG: MoxR family ATPase [Candidatus Pelagibacter sp. TMED239]